MFNPFKKNRSFVSIQILNSFTNCEDCQTVIAENQAFLQESEEGYYLLCAECTHHLTAPAVAAHY